MLSPIPALSCARAHGRPSRPARRPRAGWLHRVGLGVLAAAGALSLALVTAVGPAQAAVRSTAAMPAREAAHPALLSVDPYTDSYTRHKTEVEPDALAHGSTVVSAFQVSRDFIGAAANIGWATSLNGGRTWRHGFLPGSTINATPPGKYARGSDASVAYDARYHTWLISWLGAPSITSNSVVDVLVSRSRDGVHWSAPVPIAQRHQFLDKNWTTCDNSRFSLFYGNCYTEFEDPSQNDLIFMATSADGGRTWPLLNNTANKAHGLGGQPVVQPDGTVIVPITVFSGGQAALVSFTSATGGQSWSRTHLIAIINLHNSAGHIRNGSGLSSAGIDATGRVYVSWSDCRFEPDCDANDIVLSSSANGTTWTAPTRIPLDPVGSKVDHFTPGLGVDAATGGAHAHLALGYYYYPRANCTAATCRLFVAYTSSVNGGRTWSRPARLAGPMRVTWLAPTDSGYMAGDYMATAVVPGTGMAFPVFASAGSPTGTLLHENMYTSAERVSGGSQRAVAPRVRGHSPLTRPGVPPVTAF